MENVMVDIKGPLAEVTITRPKALNALNCSMLKELKSVFTGFAENAQVKVVLITGSGNKAFVAGADIAEMKDYDVLQARAFGRLGQSVFSLIEKAPQVVIAAVNGYALGGGCELAMACDIRIASTKAKFGQPEVSLGVIPGFGGTQRLPRLVGKGRAKEIIFSGNMIDAAEAHRIGLVNRVCEPEKLMDEARALAADILLRSQSAVALAKQAINTGLNMDDESAFYFESELWGACFSTEDQKEGMDAFLNKRSPEFIKKNVRNVSKDIYVVVEQRDGDIQKVGIELIGAATGLAKELGQKVVGVLMGNGIAGKAEVLIQYGADSVLVADHPLLKEYMTEPYAKALTHIIKTYEPEIVLFGATAVGRDLAPRVSSRIKTGLTADCTGLDIDPETKLLQMTRPAFGGNIMATILCKNHRPQMATVRPGVMPALARDKSRTGDVTNVEIKLDEKDLTVEILDVVKSEKAICDITEAKYLISGGRGIGGPEGFELLRKLAEALGSGADISSSRANVDAGWIAKDRQVGQTGKTVRPNLYMACGISGAIQHLAGMEESECIIAINKNESAPVFGVADLGVVGDVNAIIPKLIDEIARVKETKMVQ